MIEQQQDDSLTPLTPSVTPFPPLPDEQLSGTVGQWRQEWQRSILEATLLGSKGKRLTNRRLRYGTFTGIALDVLLVILCEIGLVALTVAIAAIVLASPNVGNVSSGDAITSWFASPGGAIINILITDLGLLIVLWVRLRRMGMNWSLFGLDAQVARGTGRAIGWGILLGVVGLSASLLVYRLLRGVGIHEGSSFVADPMMHAPAGLAVLLAAMGTFVAPLVEELTFRGYVFRALATRHNMVWAYIISSGLFAASHLDATRIPGIFLVGALFAFGYQRTGNILCNMTAHAVNNGLPFLLLLLVH